MHFFLVSLSIFLCPAYMGLSIEIVLCSFYLFSIDLCPVPF